MKIANQDASQYPTKLVKHLTENIKRINVLIKVIPQERKS